MSWRLASLPPPKDGSSTGGAGDEPAVRKAKTAKPEVEEERLATLAAKAGMQALARIRELEGAVYETVLIARSSAPAVAMADEGKLYASRAGDGMDLGPPHVHKYAALLDSLVSLKLEEQKPEIKWAVEALVAHRAQLEHATQAQVNDWVSHLEAASTYDKPGKEKKDRITFKVEGEVEIATGDMGEKERRPLKQILLTLLIAAGGSAL